jgi:hypothetical protein
VRIVRSAQLWFVEGKSDKVYEIEIVEVAAEQFVVNIRFGRRGSALRDGTKTANPVPLVKAQAIFDELVADKRNGGYQGDAIDASAQSAGSGSAASAAGSPYRSAGSLAALLSEESDIVRRLGQGRKRHDTLHRDVWRIGDYGTAQAEPNLLELLRSCKDTDTDSKFAGGVMAALATCGSQPAMTRLLDIGLSNHSLSAWAGAIGLLICKRLQADAPQRRALLQRWLPPTLWSLVATLALDGGSADLRGLLLSEAQRCIATSPEVGNRVAMGLYTHGSSVGRLVAHDLVRCAEVNRQEWRMVRSLYKLSELARDGSMFALCARKIDSAESLDRPRNYLGTTAQYFRRRTARVLRRLGTIKSHHFVAMAAELLLSYEDRDAGDAFMGLYDHHWPVLARFHALNMLLHQHSKLIVRGGHRASAWRLSPRRHNASTAAASLTSDHSTAAFPTLWLAQPQYLWRLVRSGRLTDVCQFAGAMLKQVPAFVKGLSDAELADAMEFAHVVGQQVAFECARTRTVSVTLGRGASFGSCSDAHLWIVQFVIAHPMAIVESAEWIAVLAFANVDQLHVAAMDVLKQRELPALTQRDVVLRTIAMLLTVHQPPMQAARFERATTLLKTFARSPMRELSVEMLVDMIAHPQSAVGELAGEMMMEHAHRASLPTALVESLLASPHPGVRSWGGRLVATMPVELAKDAPDALVAFATSANAELRHATRGLIGEVARQYPAVGQKMAAGLISLLQKALPLGAPAHMVTLLKHELAHCLPQVPTATILRMVGALSPHTRDAGALLVSQISVDDIALDALSKLAHNDAIAVRHAAWHLVSAAESRYLLAPVALSRLVDGAWQDGRQFAMNFVDQLIARHGCKALGADAIVAMCDSIRFDVEAFGQRLLLSDITDDNALYYVQRLAEHPSVNVQLLLSGLLAHHASGNHGAVERLLPFFATVLTAVNRGKVAKQRVLAFISAEVARDANMAALLAPLLDRQSATIAVTQKAALIAAMVNVHTAHPGVELPIEVRTPPLHRVQEAKP